MRIATWNVNSVRARLPLVLDWLERRRPDVVCLQEIKCLDEQFPTEPIEEAGYHVETFGQKTYNGVAILSRSMPDDVQRGFPGDEHEDQHRVIRATFGDLMLVNVYVVNGESVGSDKFDVKLRWLGNLAQYVAASFDPAEKLVMTGDFNCTFDDRDVYAPERWRERILCSTPEREALARVMQPGLHDAFRKFHEDAGHYTWWDFRTRGFERGNGLRIDHFLMSEPALDACSDVMIDVEERGRKRPSDHAPVLATIDAG